MPKAIGFTGTRYGMTDLQAAVFEGLLGDVKAFHHGSCKGADVEAAHIAHKAFPLARIVCHPGPDGDEHQVNSGVDHERWTPKTHFARNRDIVAACDEMIACPKEMQEQQYGGTWFTVRYARKIGKQVTVIWPDGSIHTTEISKPCS